MDITDIIIIVQAMRQQHETRKTTHPLTIDMTEVSPDIFAFVPNINKTTSVSPAI